MNLFYHIGATSQQHRIQSSLQCSDQVASLVLAACSAALYSLIPLEV